MEEKILKLLDEIKKLLGGNTENYALPQNTFYLNDGILCMERKTVCQGILTIWTV